MTEAPDIGKEGETDYLVMEYLDGETLAERASFCKSPHRGPDGGSGQGKHDQSLVAPRLT